jgi:carbonic anhydrase
MSTHGMTAQEAFERLRAGNRRFAADLRSLEAVAGRTRRADLLAGQQPFAIILGCSDSRVPAEIVFDQGLGDLFVIRVAGNIVAPSQIGSVEFAATKFGTPMVVVLGHSRCGAVDAAVKGGKAEGHIEDLVEAIKPAVSASKAAARASISSIILCSSRSILCRASISRRRNSLS